MSSQQVHVLQQNRGGVGLLSRICPPCGRSVIDFASGEPVRWIYRLMCGHVICYECFQKKGRCSPSVPELSVGVFCGLCETPARVAHFLAPANPVRASTLPVESNTAGAASDARQQAEGGGLTPKVEDAASTADVASNTVFIPIGPSSDPLPVTGSLKPVQKLVQNQDAGQENGPVSAAAKRDDLWTRHGITMNSVIPLPLRLTTENPVTGVPLKMGPNQIVCAPPWNVQRASADEPQATVSASVDMSRQNSAIPRPSRASVPRPILPKAPDTRPTQGLDSQGLTRLTLVPYGSQKLAQPNRHRNLYGNRVTQRYIIPQQPIYLLQCPVQKSKENDEIEIAPCRGSSESFNQSIISPSALPESMTSAVNHASTFVSLVMDSVSQKPMGSTDRISVSSNPRSVTMATDKDSVLPDKNERVSGGVACASPQSNTERPVLGIPGDSTGGTNRRAGQGSELFQPSAPESAENSTSAISVSKNEQVQVDEDLEAVPPKHAIKPSPVPSSPTSSTGTHARSVPENPEHSTDATTTLPVPCIATPKTPSESPTLGTDCQQEEVSGHRSFCFETEDSEFNLWLSSPESLPSDVIENWDRVEATGARNRSSPGQRQSRMNDVSESQSQNTIPQIASSTDLCELGAVVTSGVQSNSGGGVQNGESGESRRQIGHDRALDPTSYGPDSHQEADTDTACCESTNTPNVRQPKIGRRKLQNSLQGQVSRQGQICVNFDDLRNPEQMEEGDSRQGLDLSVRVPAVDLECSSSFFPTMQTAGSRHGSLHLQPDLTQYSREGMTDTRGQPHENPGVRDQQMEEGDSLQGLDLSVRLPAVDLECSSSLFPTTQTAGSGHAGGGSGSLHLQPDLTQYSREGMTDTSGQPHEDPGVRGEQSSRITQQTLIDDALSSIRAANSHIEEVLKLFGEYSRTARSPRDDTLRTTDLSTILEVGCRANDRIINSLQIFQACTEPVENHPSQTRSPIDIPCLTQECPLDLTIHGDEDSILSTSSTLSILNSPRCASSSPTPSVCSDSGQSTCGATEKDCGDSSEHGSASGQGDASGHDDASGHGNAIGIRPCSVSLCKSTTSCASACGKVCRRSDKIQSSSSCSVGGLNVDVTSAVNQILDPVSEAPKFQNSQVQILTEPSDARCLLSEEVAKFKDISGTSRDEVDATSPSSAENLRNGTIRRRNLPNISDVTSEEESPSPAKKSDSPSRIPGNRKKETNQNCFRQEFQKLQVEEPASHESILGHERKTQKSNDSIATSKEYQKLVEKPCPLIQVKGKEELGQVMSKKSTSGSGQEFKMKQAQKPCPPSSVQEKKMDKSSQSVSDRDSSKSHAGNRTTKEPTLCTVVDTDISQCCNKFKSKLNETKKKDEMAGSNISADSLNSKSTKARDPSSDIIEGESEQKGSPTVSTDGHSGKHLDSVTDTRPGARHSRVLQETKEKCLVISEPVLFAEGDSSLNQGSKLERECNDVIDDAVSDIRPNPIKTSKYGAPYSNLSPDVSGTDVSDISPSGSSEWRFLAPDSSTASGSSEDERQESSNSRQRILTFAEHRQRLSQNRSAIQTPVRPALDTITGSPTSCRSVYLTSNKRLTRSGKKTLLKEAKSQQIYAFTGDNADEGGAESSDQPDELESEFRSIELTESSPVGGPVTHGTPEKNVPPTERESSLLMGVTASNKKAVGATGQDVTGSCQKTAKNRKRLRSESEQDGGRVEEASGTRTRIMEGTPEAKFLPRTSEINPSYTAPSRLGHNAAGRPVTKTRTRLRRSSESDRVSRSLFGPACDEMAKVRATCKYVRRLPFTDGCSSDTEGTAMKRRRFTDRSSCSDTEGTPRKRGRKKRNKDFNLDEPESSGSEEVIPKMNRRGLSLKEKEMCFTVLNTVYNYKGSEPFQYVIDVNTVPNYQTIVKEPIYLNLIGSRLRRGEYVNIKEFVRDMKLVFHNCRLYHSSNPLKVSPKFIEAGRMVETFLDHQLKQVFPKTDFSDIIGHRS